MPNFRFPFIKAKINKIKFVSFSPSDISGLLLWLKSDSLSLNNDDAVSTWTDSSLSGNDATQATGTRQPLYKTNIVNGKSVVRFDGSNDRLDLSGINLSNSSFSMFIVFKDGGSTSSYSQLIATNGGNGFYYRGSGASSDFGKLNYYNFTDFHNNTALTQGTWYYASIISSSLNLTFYVNGISDGTATLTSTSDNLTKIGNDHVDGSRLLGDIAELLVYNTAVVGSNLANLHNYLATKYGFTAHDSDAEDFFTRVASNGGTMKDSTKTAVNNFVLSAKSNGYWSKLHRINLFCGNNLNAVLVPLKVGSGNSTDTNTNFVSGDYSESTGLTGSNSGSKYLDTGINIATTFTAHDTHQALYIRSTTVTNGGIWGVLSPSRMCIEIPNSTSGNVLDDQYDSGSGRVSVGSQSAQGFHVGTRTASNSHVVYRNGSSTGSNATNGGSLPSRNWFVFCSNVDGTPGTYTDHTCAGYSIGLGLTGTDVSNYNTDLETFNDALGRGIQ